MEIHTRAQNNGPRQELTAQAAQAMQALGVRTARCQMTARALCERGCPQHAGFPRTRCYRVPGL